ncbi:DUF2147 domain-containing protein [Kordiimonas sp. SCSIO 12610]|uniref:DUF2147 domain-containing protein n=1 Tax=Kordiimonas sp. SCSIO 12610 TaxID=2829597 RepID=UPI00210CD749|nr:DUF2147 domain-containing protein [Kordiimonas sp. SCSIO 12610]UTW54528.1 DUF2147 domain-containing protein [Kordiimonas sp. SCSIO 12610]
MRKYFIVAISLFLVSLSASSQDYKAYEGYFWTEAKDAIFEITVVDGENGPDIKGITRWGAAEGGFDTQNPDPELQNRSLIDLTFLWGFTYKPKKNRWADGKVYDPNNGKTYSGKMSLEKEGSVLKMRGYIGVSLFGRTAKFERVKPEDLPETLTAD